MLKLKLLLLSLIKLYTLACRSLINGLLSYEEINHYEIFNRCPLHSVPLIYISYLFCTTLDVVGIPGSSRFGNFVTERETMKVDFYFCNSCSSAKRVLEDFKTSDCWFNRKTWTDSRHSAYKVAGISLSCVKMPLSEKINVRCRSWHFNGPHPTIIFLLAARNRRCRKNYANGMHVSWNSSTKCCSLVRSTVFKLIHHSRLICLNLNFWCLAGKVVLKFISFSPASASGSVRLLQVHSNCHYGEIYHCRFSWGMLVLSIKSENISFHVGLSKRLPAILKAAQTAEI